MFAANSSNMPENDSSKADAHTRFDVREPPRWITGFNRVPQHVAAQTGGDAPTDVLLVDRQLLPDRRIHYLRQVQRLNNAQGVEKLSQVSLDFDPATESLTIHSIRIWRDGEPHERAKREDFKLIQRETNLERQIYDGRMSAVALLEDVRVGDLIDISASRRVEHPALATHFHAIMQCQHGVPVVESNISVLYKDAPPRWKRLGEEETPPSKRELKSGWTLLTWSAKNLPAQKTEINTPGWHIQSNSLQLSDFESWAEVAHWVHALWGKVAAPDSLREVAREIETNVPESDPARRADRAFAFVRDEIRYLGLEEGLGALQPCPVDDVMRRRFGDCKDKSRILCLLLRMLKIPAAPVLVNTEVTHGIRHLLPSPTAFDHVIVRAQIDGNSLWLDATRRSAAHSVTDMVSPDYGCGLTISSKAKGLVKIPHTPRDASLLSVKEDFHVVHPDRPARLDVERTGSGFEAEHLRELLGTVGMVKYREFREAELRDFFPRSQAIGEWTVDDSDADGRVTVREKFEIEDFTLRGEEGQRGMPLGASSIRLRFPGLPEGERKTPWALPFPCRIRHEIRCQLPFKPPKAVDEKQVKCTAFGFGSRVTIQGRDLKAVYKYWSNADHIEPENVNAFKEKVEEMAGAMSHVLNFPTSFDLWKERPGESHERRRTRRRVGQTESQRINRSLVTGIVVVFLLVVGTVGRVVMRESSNRPPVPTLSGEEINIELPNPGALQESLKDALLTGVPKQEPLGSEARGCRSSL